MLEELEEDLVCVGGEFDSTSSVAATDDDHSLFDGKGGTAGRNYYFRLCW